MAVQWDFVSQGPQLFLQSGYEEQQQYLQLHSCLYNVDAVSPSPTACSQHQTRAMRAVLARYGHTPSSALLRVPFNSQTSLHFEQGHAELSGVLLSTVAVDGRKGIAEHGVCPALRVQRERWAGTLFLREIVKLVCDLMHRDRGKEDVEAWKEQAVLGLRQAKPWSAMKSLEILHELGAVAPGCSKVCLPPMYRYHWTTMIAVAP